MYDNRRSLSLLYKILFHLYKSLPEFPVGDMALWLTVPSVRQPADKSSPILLQVVVSDR